MSFDLLPPQAAAALAAGNKIEAIKQLRLARGMSLAEATAVIEAHERGVARGFEDLRPSVSSHEGKLVIPPDAVDAMRKGDWMVALKVLREVKGVGLAEAKAALEQMKRQAPQSAGMKPRHEIRRPKGLSPGEVPRGGDDGSGLWIALVAGAAAVIYWALFRS